MRLSRLLILAVVTVVSTLTAVAAPVIRVANQRSLPPNLRWTQDVRWASDQTVFVAAGRAGVFEIGTSSSSAAVQVVPGAEQHGFMFSSRLAASDGYLVVGSPFAAVAAVQRKANSHLATIPFTDAVDLDVDHDKVVILGGNRDEQGKWAADGGIVFLGSASAKLADLKAVQFSRDGAGAHSMNDCGILELGAVRFLADGSFLVVPGVEPGVTLHDATGKVVYAWQSEGLGFHDNCTIDEGQRKLLTGSEPPRVEWINRRAVLDDILPLADGPALIVREYRDGSVRWHAVQLRRNLPARTIDLPIASHSPYAHLRADARGTHLVFAVIQYGDLKAAPVETPRLVFAEYTP